MTDEVKTMVNSGKELCERLSVAYDERLEPYFKRGVELFSEYGYFAFDKERIIKLNEKYNFIRRYMDEILLGCDEVRRDEDLVLFVYVLAAIYEAGTTPTFWDVDHNVVMMGIPDRERLDTDIAPLYSAFFFLEKMIAEYESRGLPHEVISDTLFGMNKEMDDYLTMVGRVGMRRYVSWYSNWTNMVLLTVGRLQFKIWKETASIRVYRKGDDYKILMDGVEMHKGGMCFGSAGQDDEDGKYFAEIKEEGGAVIGYAANEFGECDPNPVRLEGYEEVLRYGDPCIDVHIPADLPLTPEICIDSYERAKEIFRKCYPEFKFKGIICHSWMLEKRLEEIQGKKSNVTRFADPFYGYPLKSSGAAVYSFVFKLPAPIPADELPEETSMQRAVKKHLMNGGHVYEKGGFMPV